ncbi:hypothetical protein SAMN05421875_1571, partial [Acidovorax soli]
YVISWGGHGRGCSGVWEDGHEAMYRLRLHVTGKRCEAARCTRNARCSANLCLPIPTGLWDLGAHTNGPWILEFDFARSAAIRDKMVSSQSLSHRGHPITGPHRCLESARGLLREECNINRRSTCTKTVSSIRLSFSKLVKRSRPESSSLNHQTLQSFAGMSSQANTLSCMPTPAARTHGSCSLEKVDTFPINRVISCHCALASWP